MKRRDFIKSAAAASAGIAAAPMVFDGMQVHAGSHKFAEALSGADNDNILIVVQLFGGNDGLNTFVPYQDSMYYQNRPTLGIAPNKVLKINNPTMGFHPSMAGFQNLFAQGKLAVVQGVGYENANRSHFRSTDIWLTGSGAGSVLNTGWGGRYLEYAYPTFPLDLPADPIAIQIGGTMSLMLQSDKGNMGISLRDPQAFFDLGASAGLDEAVPETSPYGKEYMFIRAIKQQSDVYRQRVIDAFNAGTNIGQYSTAGLAQQLRLVGRLISGGLKSKMYMVYLGGFDTHTNQGNTHERLLETLTSSVYSFLEDMQNQGHGQRIVGLTMSEFGRRTRENGSLGTDHGTSSVQFVFGEPVNSGVLGHDPDFTLTDNSGDLVYNFDYRQIYSEILERWFAVPEADVTQMLGGRFVPLPLVRTSVGTAPPDRVSDFQLQQNYPNPFSGSTGTTAIPFSIAESSYIALKVYDVRGRELADLASGFYPPGKHEIAFAPKGLPAGNYYYRLSVGKQHVTRRMNVGR